tara:strand:- start:7 stop:1779 length:1773 start_codon:yes stop_codon:yes gene_type:complete
MANISPVQDLDFFETKTALKNYLSNQDRFADYDFEGSNMNVLLDLLAYNTFYNNYYYNMAISEMFLDSAQERNSMISHAKELNYLPRSRRSAKAVVTFNITATQSGNFFVIPKDTKISGKCGNVTFTFLTEKAYTAVTTQVATDPLTPRLYTIANVEVFQGRLITETLDISDTTLSNKMIDTRSLYVEVNEEEYVYKTDIFGITATDKVFYLQPEEDEKYSLQFGQDKFGKQPTAGDTITAKYRISSAEEANGVTSMTSNGLAGAANVSIVVTTPSNGGLSAETVESIRAFAPKALQVQERAVTTRDYEILLRNRFPNIEAISVYGGDEVDPPQFGKVIISVDVTGGEGAADFEIASFTDYLKDKTPLTIEPVFVPAKFLFVDTVVDVVFDPNITTKSASQIRSEVTSAITAYSTASLADFNKTLRQSRLAATLDAVDNSIISSSIFASPIIQYVPVLNTVSNPAFSYETALVQPYAFDATTGLSGFTPAVRTTKLTIEGTLVTLQDDGAGKMMAVTASTSSVSVFKRSIGTINYTTGAIKLSNLIVDSYEGGAIKFIANSVAKDIKAPKDRIITIRGEDITVNVTTLTE